MLSCHWQIAVSGIAGLYVSIYLYKKFPRSKCGTPSVHLAGGAMSEFILIGAWG